MLPAASCPAPRRPLQVFTDSRVVTTNPCKSVDPLSCPGPPSWPRIRASAAGAGPLRVLHNETLVFSADQGASVTPRGKQQHFGRKQAAVVNGRSRTAPGGWEEAPPPGSQASAPGRLQAPQGGRGCRWWEKAPRAGGRTAPQALAGLRAGPSWGEGASLRLLKKPRLSSGCAGALSCRRPAEPHARALARPSPPGRPPPARAISFPARSASDVSWGGRPLSTCPSLAQGHRAVGRKQPEQPPKCSLKSR